MNNLPFLHQNSSRFKLHIFLQVTQIVVLFVYPIQKDKSQTTVCDLRALVTTYSNGFLMKGSHLSSIYVSVVFTEIFLNMQVSVKQLLVLMIRLLIHRSSHYNALKFTVCIQKGLFPINTNCCKIHTLFLCFIPTQVL